MSSGRLLIVDDEPDFAEFVARVGRDLGYDTAVTTSARAFQDAYLAVPADVIVLDIVMPERDGIEMIKWLVDQSCRARIVIVSGYNPLFAAAARAIGESTGQLEISQMQKPVKLAELRARLKAGPVTTQPGAANLS